MSGYSSPQSVVGGLYKPQRTDVSGAPANASLKVLLVFVQFANETVAADNWPIGGAPVFMDEMFALTQNSSGNYWDRYNENTECLSDWYQEVSKGQMHVTGKAVNVILKYDAIDYLNYSTDPDVRMRYMNAEIFDQLPSLGVVWSEYDRMSGSDGNFYYQPDTYIDMIIKVHRTKTINGLFYADAPGYALLGYSPFMGIDIPVPGGKYINDGFYSSFASGLTICGTVGGPASKSMVFNIAKHEYGHYLFGSGHTATGVGIMGSDVYLGAWESKKLGYLTTTIVDFSTPTQTLGDISSRSSNGEILQVPINGATEYFLITNRRQVSHYDRTMLGDTTKGIWDRVLDPSVDYGKGVYIYHHNHDLDFPGANDLECADGLWNWANIGTSTPDWNDNQYIDVYQRTTIPNPLLNDNGSVSYSNKDGRTVGHETGYGPSFDAWFGIGKRHTVPNGEATDRTFTNDEDYWTSRENGGDRWDAYKLEYNEIFSPFSNPSSIGWYDSPSNIYIYYNGLSGTNASINIYKVGENNMTEDDILAATPPSKPMGIKIDRTACIDGKRYPIISWSHNTEPDMLPNLSTLKRYKVFRAFDGINTVPQNWTEIADVTIDQGTTPTYTDLNAYGECFGSLWGDVNRIRYKIKAVDKTNWASVYSDFVSITTEFLNRRGGGNSPEFNSETPKQFNLSQNYPNPFNPVTKINFALPKQGFVTLKIYDITGREIQTLVSEVKQAGYYSVDFNASSLSSGVYFYKIQSGDFISVKRMVLIK
jgi:hypothetical protein